jgi:hypothetical protein
MTVVVVGVVIAEPRDFQDRRSSAGGGGRGQQGVVIEAALRRCALFERNDAVGAGEVRAAAETDDLSVG